MKNSIDKSRNLFEETERENQFFPLETQMIIRDRYDFAASLARDKRVLEVGTGQGLGLSHLSSVSKSLKCLELSDENLNFLNDKFSDYSEFYKGSAESMPFKSGDFDFIIALAMVYYLSLDAFLKEANRLLISEGKLLFCTSNKDVPGFVKAPFTTQYYSIPELRDLLHAAGFKVSFFGAFPSRRGSLHKHRIKATFKNIAKKIITFFPGGKIFWEKIRNSTLKDLKPLPGDILKMPKYSGGRYLLSQDDPNTLYRVIYVVAKKVKTNDS